MIAQNANMSLTRGIQKSLRNVCVEEQTLVSRRL